MELRQRVSLPSLGYTGLESYNISALAWQVAAWNANPNPIVLHEFHFSNGIQQQSPYTKGIVNAISRGISYLS